MAAFLNIKFEAKIFMTSIRTRPVFGKRGLLGGHPIRNVGPCGAFSACFKEVLGLKIKTGAPFELKSSNNTFMLSLRTLLF